MLEIGSKTIIVDGVTVFLDQKDPTHYFYIPLTPKLIVSKDEKSGFVIPKVQLIKFRTKNIQGGVFYCDIELNLDEDQIEKLRKAIIRENKIDGTLRLDPVSFSGGHAKLIMYGKDNDEPSELGFSKLFENNRLSFHANVDVAGALTIEKALQGEDTPIVLSCSLDFYQETDLKRTVSPQIFLKELLRPLQKSSFDSSNFVTHLDLDDQFFRGRTLKLMAISDFESDDIDTIEVSLNYGGTQKAVVLDRENREANLHWSAKQKDGKMIRSVTVSYTVRFKNGMSNGSPYELSSEEVITQSQQHFIAPQNLFSTMAISVVALDVPWDKYPSVEIKTKSNENERGISFNKDIQLNAENPKAELSLIVTDPSKKAYKYKLIYKSKEGSDIEKPWEEMDELILVIRDPFLER